MRRESERFEATRRDVANTPLLKGDPISRNPAAGKTYLPLEEPKYQVRTWASIQAGRIGRLNASTRGNLGHIFT